MVVSGGAGLVVEQVGGDVLLQQLLLLAAQNGLLDVLLRRHRHLWRRDQRKKNLHWQSFCVEFSTNRRTWATKRGASGAISSSLSAKLLSAARSSRPALAYMLAVSSSSSSSPWSASAPAAAASFLARHSASPLASAVEREKERKPFPS